MTQATEQTTYSTFFGDGIHHFRLTPELIVELERLTGHGIGGVFRRLIANDYRHRDLIEVVRLALIGGGTPPQEAGALVDAYAAAAPIMPTYNLAVSILEALLFGVAEQPQTEDEKVTRE